MAELAHKVRVNITIHSVKMTFRTPIDLNIIWKRKNRRVEIGSKVPIPAGSAGIAVEQTLTMTETVLFNRTGGLQEHTAELFFQALVDRGAKVVGKVVVGLGMEVVDHREMSIESCPDKTAVVVLSINSQTDGESDNAPSDRSLRLGTRRLKLSSSRQELSGSLEKDWEAQSIDKARLQELTAHMEDLETQNSSLTATVNDLKKKVRTAADDYRKKEEDWESRLKYYSHSDLEHERSKAVRNLQRVQSEAAESTVSSSAAAEMTELQGQLQASTTEVTKLRRDVREMTEAKRKAEAGLDFEKSQSDTYQRAVEDLTRTLKDVKEDRERLKTDLAAANERAAGLNRTVEELKKELNSAKTQSQSSEEASQMTAKLQSQLKEAEQRYTLELSSLSTSHTEAEISRLASGNEEEMQGNESEIRAEYEQQMREMREEAEKERDQMSEEAEGKMTEMENWYRGQIDNLSKR